MVGEAFAGLSAFLGAVLPLAAAAENMLPPGLFGERTDCRFAIVSLILRHRDTTGGIAT
jgi:hypothetical protein